MSTVMDRYRARPRAIVGALTGVVLCVGVGSAALGAPAGEPLAFSQVPTDPLTTLLTTTTTLEVEPVDSVLEPIDEQLEPVGELLDPAGDSLTTTTTTTVATTTTSSVIATTTSSVVDDPATAPVATTSTTEASDTAVAPPREEDGGSTGLEDTARIDEVTGVDESPSSDHRLRSFLASSGPIVGVVPSDRTAASGRNVVLAFFADGLGPFLETLVVGPLLALAALWEAVLSAGAGLAAPASALMTLVVVLGLDRRRPGAPIVMRAEETAGLENGGPGDDRG